MGSDVQLIRPVGPHFAVEALLLLLIPLAVLLLRRIVRRAYSRSYRLPPQEVDLEELYKEVKD